MTALVPLGAAALAGVPAIVLLYFLKVRRPPLTVSSLMLWLPHLRDRQANAPWQRVRATLLLVVQLVAAAALGLALMRPALTGASGFGGVTVVMLDASATMSATDVAPSRFGAAVERARALVRQIPPGGRMALVLLDTHAQLLAPPTGDAGELEAALARARAGTGRANLDQGLSLAAAVLAGRGQGSIVVIGDGHAQPGGGPPRSPAPVTFLSVGTSGENAAITALLRSPSGNVLARVTNFGRGARDVRVEMLADGRLVDVLPLHAGGNTTADLTWAGLPIGAGVLEARLDPPDAFTLDDSAWLVTSPPTERRVLLVTDQNGFMARAIGLRSGVRLTQVTPAAYRPGDYDLYVFDRFVPAGVLPVPALLIDPPKGTGPLPGGPEADPGPVLPASPDEPLLADVSLRDVHVQVAARTTVTPDWRVVMAGTAGPLLVVRQAEPRIAQFTFDIHHSDLPLRAAFPILVRNLLGHLLPGGFEGSVVTAGTPVTLEPEVGAGGLTVETPDGRRQAVAATGAAFAGTSAPGVYIVTQTVSGRSHTSRFAVDFSDPGLSRIAPGPAPSVLVSGGSAPLPEHGVLELWPWLVLLAVGALVVEWAVYHRGI